MKPTTVVNVRTEQCDVYVGRAVRRRPDLLAHPLANPFKLNKAGTDREEVLAQYEGWLKDRYRKERQLINVLLDNLQGLHVGCWCSPSGCHADLLAKLADMTSTQRDEWAGVTKEEKLRSLATGYRVAVKDMHEWAAWGGDYYGYDLDNEVLSEDFFGMSEEDACKEFDDGHDVARDNVVITPIFVCSNDGKEIVGQPFHVGESSHFFCNEDCFYEHDAAVMDKLRGKYS